MKRHSKKSGILSLLLSNYLWIALFVAISLANLGFYLFYLYLKYANDREAVRPYYDDEKKQLLQPYVNVSIGLVVPWLIIGFICLVMTVKGNIGSGGQFIVYVVFAIVFAIAWVIDRLAAAIAGKKAEPVIKGRY